MQPVRIKKGIYWIGALNPNLRIFDIIMKTEWGTTYNSYLVKSNDKIAVFETVKDKFTDDFIDNLKSLVDIKYIDYVIVSHTEPDHSGSLGKLLELAPNIKVVSSKVACRFAQEIINKEIDCLTVGDGDTLDLGGKTLRFFSTPFLHWPDSILTYLVEDKILFSCDVFGSHYCDDRLFDDLVDDFTEVNRYYFDHIMRPFKDNVLEALNKIKDLDIEIIATGHGPILRQDPQKYIKRYTDWASIPRKEGNKKIIIAYISAYGNTTKMAKEIAKGASSNGVRVSLHDLIWPDIPTLVDEIEAADGLLVGSPTINGDAVKPVWDLLSSLATLKLKGKTGAAFGSYGWSGEAVKMLEDRMRSLKFKVIEPGVRANFVPDEEDLAKCEEFGRKFAEAL